MKEHSKERKREKRRAKEAMEGGQKENKVSLKKERYQETENDIKKLESQKEK